MRLVNIDAVDNIVAVESLNQRVAQLEQPTSDEAQVVAVVERPKPKKMMTPELLGKLLA